MSEGYCHCECRDCMTTIIDGGFCDECVEAGCPDYQGVEGMSQECQSPHTGAMPDCPKCKKADEVYYDAGDYHCERCDRPEGGE